MSDISKEKNKKGNASASLSQFIVNNRIIVIVVLVLIVAILGGLVAFFVYRDDQKGKIVLLSEEIDQAYVNWLRAEEGEKSSKETEFLSLTEKARKQYPGSFAVQRSLYSEGLFYLEKKDYAKAAQTFQELGENYKKSYLAPESYFNAASAYEMSGDLDKAIECLSKILELYKTESPVAPEACFNIGRLYDTKGDKEKAVSYFEQVLNDFPESDWSGVAQTKLIELKIKD